MIRYLVFGMGETGLSVARHFKKMNIQAVYYDTRLNPPNLPSFEKIISKSDVILGNFNDRLFEDIDCLVVSPGLSDKEPLIQKALQLGIKIISDIDLFVENVTKDFVVVTGSNGKSTVTELLSLMCKKSNIKVSAGANLGRPALELLKDNADLYLLELSSFHLHRCQKLPAKVAVLLNISNDHLDWHGSEKNYHQAKYRIYKEALSSVYNRNLKGCLSHLNSNPRISFGLCEAKGNHYGILSDGADKFLSKNQKKLLSSHKVKILGSHNLENILAAMAVGELIGLDISPMIEAIKEFKGLPHRMEFVENYKSIEFINDSKGTNVGAAIASINSLDGPIILLAGGQGKGGDFKFFANSVHKKIKKIILFGKDSKLIEKEFKDYVSSTCVESLKDAVHYATKYGHEGDKVLLSPACASFDQFDSYISRGEEFCRIVRGLN
ncbi:UDP-N-acetylmuramoyl-L-alanine--D-glutamate ligase [Woeseiaceae bacterium]|jgi:UDP-N-acetylmuramoylalanine--D-glutamate ligase|nr:UDP-N-acetylmuramoyl-L-alanine--D-glutamate ligase [Woeseiaceae bacterium]